MNFLWSACSQPDSQAEKQLVAKNNYLKVDDHVRFQIKDSDKIANPQASKNCELHFEKPETWQEAAPQQFRNLNFSIPDSDIQCYVTIIPRKNDLLQNINRWRNQLQLGNTMDLPKEKITFLGESCYFIEIEDNKQSQKTLGVIYLNDQETITFKMSGNYDHVNREKKNFITTASSISKCKANNHE